jgi:hypothetical protein
VTVAAKDCGVVYVDAPARFHLSQYPEVAKLFSEQLKANGFQVTEDPTKADSTFEIASGVLSFSEIDRNAKDFARRSEKFVAAAITVMANPVTIMDQVLSFTGKGRRGRADLTVAISNFHQKTVTSTFFEYQADADTPEVTAAIFTALTREWIRTRVVTPQTASSAIIPTQSMADSPSTKQEAR